MKQLLAIGVAVGLYATLAHAQSPLAPSTNAAIQTGAPVPQSANAAKSGLSEDEYRAELIAHLPKEKSEGSNDALIAGIVGVFAAVLSFIGAYVAAKMADAAQQRTVDQQMNALVFSAKTEQEKVRIQTSLNFTTKTLDLRLKQLEEFYAPLLAYCHQMKGLRQNLETYLLKNHSGKYRTISGETTRLEIAIGTEWQDFRMIDHLPAIKGDKTANELAKKIVEIGNLMVTIIQKQNGLANVGHQISPVYGEFLTHSAILNMVFADESRTDPYPSGWHSCAYYPRDLDSVIEKGYRETWDVVIQYKALSDSALASLKQKS